MSHDFCAQRQLVKGILIFKNKRRYSEDNFLILSKEQIKNL